MERIKTYFNELLSSESSFAGNALKRAIIADYMKSGIVVMNNDSTSTLIRRDNLAKALGERVLEGMLGDVAERGLLSAQTQYTKTKSKDPLLTYAFDTYISEVQDIDKTYELFIKAISSLGELRKNSFEVPTHKDDSSKKFKPYETLIVENIVRLEEMFDKKYAGYVQNRDAVCSLATMLVLKGIAQDGEEKAIDELAIQLLPFVVNNIKQSDKRYIGDEALLETAMDLAQARIKAFNRGLKKDAYIADLDFLLQDERIYQEMNKVCRSFSEYNVNLYGKGSNGAISFINDNGELELCDITDDQYNLIEALCTTFDGTQIATEERLLRVAFANLIVIENSSRFTDEQKAQLGMAFALPVTQITNKLGDEVANQIFRETVATLAKLNSMAPSERASLPEKEQDILWSMGFDRTVIKEEREVAPTTETEPAPVIEPKKKKVQDPVVAVRKKLVKSFTTANWRYYEKLKAGKIKKSDEIVSQAKTDALTISGLMGGYSKTLVSVPADFVGLEETSEGLPFVVVTEFAKKFLEEEAERIASLEGEESKTALAETKKAVGTFYAQAMDGNPTGDTPTADRNPASTETTEERNK